MQGTVGLYESDGTVIEEVITTMNGNSWTQVLFNTPHQLLNGTTYLIMANFGSSGHAVYLDRAYISNQDPRINGLYGHYGSIPGTKDTSNIYSCNILLDDASGNLIITNQYIKESGVWNEIV